MQPLVSIISKAYNHEKYIADALDSFLAQKTDFPIEIIVHDDASADNTANIIRKYEAKYPDIIKPIYQKENQYSKRVNTSTSFVFPKVQGKYIAWCEGDDFWVDQYKLQKQVEFLESHDEYSACFHPVQVVDIKGNFTGTYKGPVSRRSKTYSIDKNGLDVFMHVSSILMKAQLFKSNMPNWFTELDIAMPGDIKLAIYLFIMGKVFFIGKVMSAYRLGVENSIMTTLRKQYSIEDWIDHHERKISIINDIDKYYEYKYHKEFEHLKLQVEINKLFLGYKFPEMKSQTVYKKLELKRKLSLNLQFYTPQLYQILKSFYVHFYPKANPPISRKP